jgi:hypothetical protein
MPAPNMEVRLEAKLKKYVDAQIKDRGHNRPDEINREIDGAIKILVTKVDDAVAEVKRNNEIMLQQILRSRGEGQS